MSFFSLDRYKYRRPFVKLQFWWRTNTNIEYILQSGGVEVMMREFILTVAVLTVFQTLDVDSKMIPLDMVPNSVDDMWCRSLDEGVHPNCCCADCLPDLEFRCGLKDDGFSSTWSKSQNSFGHGPKLS
ncbi:hypothetical protein DPEC_G00182110 [Dallia pectoralis]|uniref:Uncharacterized protein n=1 Tax=Dallia pectoralis TaxID=75939 RepID=A0ACC2GAS2_DALPE|nr:hypothetical protein DPEC_G00182110 [Dallia pectoralis]